MQEPITLTRTEDGNLSIPNFDNFCKEAKPMPPQILVITGPTASGKTWLAVELAKAHNGEVVSADSMQIYRRMDIGTA